MVTVQSIQYRIQYHTNVELTGVARPYKWYLSKVKKLIPDCGLQLCDVGHSKTTIGGLGRLASKVFLTKGV